jgi:transcription elongation factor Elf1
MQVLEPESIGDFHRIEKYLEIKMGKKRVYQFECPNCGTTNQNAFLADLENGGKHRGREPLMICTKCDSRFASRVLERIYYMGVSNSWVQEG